MGKFFRIAYVTDIAIARDIQDWLADNEIQCHAKDTTLRDENLAGAVMHGYETRLLGSVSFRFYSDDDFALFCYTWLGENVYLYPRDAFAAFNDKI